MRELYTQQIEYLPSPLYLNIEFEPIKADIAKISHDTLDYGSIILLKEKDYSVSVNKIGKITVYFNNVQPDKSLFEKIKEIFSVYKYNIDYPNMCIIK